MFLSCLLQIFCVILQRFLQSITIKNMKKFLTFIFLWLSVCTSVSAQITDTFSILKIRKAKNDCYRLTAKSNGKKYVIYSHYDAGKNAGKKIKCNDKIELEIEPFLETKQIFWADFKKFARLICISQKICYLCGHQDYILLLSGNRAESLLHNQ